MSEMLTKVDTLQSKSVFSPDCVEKYFSQFIAKPQIFLFMDLTIASSPAASSFSMLHTEKQH